MELMTEEKKRYKRTEVGLIPEDWEVKQLKECISEPLQYGIGAAAVDYNLNLPRYLRITDISDEGYLIEENKASLKVNEYSNYLLENDDIVLARTGASVGKSYHFNRDSFSGEMVFAGFLIKVKSDAKKLNPIYLKYFLKSDPYWHWVKVNSMRSGQPGINSQEYSSLKIPLPPTLEEQQAIASALSDVDELIRSLDGLIQKKQAIKKGAMQQLLTPNKSGQASKKRLPGFDGEWEKISLKQLTDRSFELFNDGDWVESDHIIDQGIRLLQTGNVGVGKFKESRNKKYINEESFKKLNCKEVKVGDLLICRLADPPGRACIVPDLKEEKMITSVDVSILRPKEDEVDKHFLLQVFSTTEWFDEVNEKCGGTTRTRISRSALGNIELSLPSYEEQKAIGTIFKDMDLELQTLRQKREKYVQIKQGMMQELLTGRVRLV